MGLTQPRVRKAFTDPKWISTHKVLGLPQVGSTFTKSQGSVTLTPPHLLEYSSLRPRYEGICQPQEFEALTQPEIVKAPTEPEEYEALT